MVSGLYAEHVRDAGVDPQQVIAGSQPSCWFMGFQVHTPPFDDMRVRVGIRAGLDVAGMVERYHPGARVASTLTPPRSSPGSSLPRRAPTSRWRVSCSATPASDGSGWSWPIRPGATPRPRTRCCSPADRHRAGRGHAHRDRSHRLLAARARGGSPRARCQKSVGMNLGVRDLDQPGVDQRAEEHRVLGRGVAPGRIVQLSRTVRAGVAEQLRASATSERGGGRSSL